MPVVASSYLYPMQVEVPAPGAQEDVDMEDMPPINFRKRRGQKNYTPHRAYFE